MRTAGQAAASHIERANLVSVIMPCYNAERYVAEAIESVLSQSYPEIELLVVDDGSTDGSRQVIEAYSDRIVLIVQSNSGAAAARNRALKSATGRYIAFLDADDYWSPHFVETMVKALQESQAVLAYCGWQVILESGRLLEPYIPPDYENEYKRISLLRDASLWPIHGMLTYRQALLDIGMFDCRLPACEDYDLWLRLTFNRPIVRVPQVLAYYRWHKPLKDTDKRARDAEYIRQIKHNFISHYPDLVNDIDSTIIRDCIVGGYLRRGRQCLSRGEYKSSQRIFRAAWHEKLYTLKDLPYILPALLPERLYRVLARLG